MALPRIIISSEPTVYHVITRVSRGEFLFGELEKERMRKMIWQLADFCGVEVLTYAVMSNHLHLVVRVPVKDELDGTVENAKVLRRFGVLYGAQMMRETGALLAQGAEAEWATFRAKYLPLMHDLSWFVRLLKQRFARWYNAFHKTFGTLWAERFTSLIVEGDGEALLSVCAYVDLNPVRAKLVEDPKDYRFSGYESHLDRDESHLDRENVMKWLESPIGCVIIAHGPASHYYFFGTDGLPRDHMNHIWTEKM